MAEEPVDVQEEPDEVLPADETVEALPTEEVTVWAPEPTGADEILSTSVEKWIADVEFESPADVPYSRSIGRSSDQSGGWLGGDQESSRTTTSHADDRRPRNGKSALARSMTDLLPKDALEDVLVYPNEDDENVPRVRTVPAGRAERIVKVQKEAIRQQRENPSECSSSPSQQSDSCCSLQPFNQVTCSRSCSVVFCWCLVTCSSEAVWGPQTTAVSRRCS